MSAPRRIFYGGIIAHTTGIKKDDFHLLTNTAIGVDNNGKIAFVDNATKIEDAITKYRFQDAEIVHLKDHQLLIPGLIDTHTHAPQWENRGIGMDLGLLQWIGKYTRPTEITFSSIEKADRVYDVVVQDTLRNGSTTVCYFATIHPESTKILADKCLKYGQRAFVGQPCLDRSSLPNYCNASADEAVEVTRQVIEHIRQRDPSFSLVRPIVTPGFAPVLSAECAKKLAALAQKEGLPMQTHLSENLEEVERMRKLFPSAKHYTDIQRQHGVLTSRTILGHCIHLSDDERALIAESGAGVSHCPQSNINLGSGECRVRWLLDAGIKVGLGCDCSGGHSTSILDNLRRASDVSRSLVSRNGPRARLELHELFYMATLGGAHVCGIENKTGSFEIGKEFDAVILDGSVGDSGHIKLKAQGEDVEDIFQKILLCSDDRNVRQVYVQGKLCINKSI